MMLYTEIPGVQFISIMSRVINLSLSLLQSPADHCKKIHAGDEVIQVNHQTVVCIIAWLTSVLTLHQSICAVMCAQV